MRKFWKEITRWMTDRSTQPTRRKTPPREKLRFDILEERAVPAGNLHYTGSVFLDGAGDQVPAPTAGEQINLRVSWTATGLAANDTYIVSATIGGVRLDSAAFTGSVGPQTAILKGWYALPTQTNYSVTIDTNNTVAETDETVADNGSGPQSFLATPAGSLVPVGVTPVALPMKFVFPIGGTPFTSWTFTQYPDLDPRIGVVQDWNLGANPISTDGATGYDVAIPTFNAMDLATDHVFAMASGQVVQVDDGFSDRVTTVAGSNPGNHIAIDHGDGWRTDYFNLALGTTAVRVGEGVAQGQTIALVGGSGVGTQPHLRFVISHYGVPVDAYLDPLNYWVAPQSFPSPLSDYQTSPFVGQLNLDQGTTNYDPTSDLIERPVITTSFTLPVPPQVPAPIYFYARVNFLNPGDVLSAVFTGPGALTFTAPTQTVPLGSILTDKAFVFSMPPANFNSQAGQGAWTVRLRINGAPVSAPSSFSVVNSSFPVQLNFRMTATNPVTSTTQYIERTRTTPIDFGASPKGIPGNRQDFVITNNGAVTLQVHDVIAPAGYSFFGTPPAPINNLLPTQSITFSVQLDTATPGEKVGSLRFGTNIGNFAYYLHGTVSGAIPSGTPVIYFPGASGATFASAVPFLLDPNATVSDSDSTAFTGGKLVVEMINSVLQENILSIRNSGNSPGAIGTTGNTVTYGGISIGTYGVLAGTSLTVNFNSNATVPAVQALVRAIAYANSSDINAVGHRYIRFALTDDTGKTSTPVIKTVYAAALPAFSSNITIAETNGGTFVTEFGPSDSYTVVLTTQPTSPVKVTIVPVSGVTTDKTVLTFTSANYNQFQTVTVTAIDDNLAQGQHLGAIVHTVNSLDPNFSGILAPSISAVITDNDPGVVITPSQGSTIVSEGGIIDTLAVTLSTPPAADVVVTLTPDPSLTLSTTTLTFTNANYNIPQIITVAAPRDGIINGTRTVFINANTTSLDTTYNNKPPAPAPVTILDVDTVNILFNPPVPVPIVSETGLSATYTLRLDSIPTAPVTITPVSSNGIGFPPAPALTITPASLTFSAADFVNQTFAEKTFTVTGVHDFVDQSPSHPAQVTYTIATTDVNYAAYVPTPTNVIVNDADTAGVTITQTGNSTDVTEGGNTDTVGVVLNTQPIAPVTVQVFGFGGRVQVGSPAANFTLVNFNSTNWNTVQNVTITAVDDAIYQGFQTKNITFNVISTDLKYAAVTPPPLPVNITDNDGPALIVTPTGGSNDLIEGSANFDSFNVHLGGAVAPTANVTVTLTSVNGQTTMSQTPFAAFGSPLVLTFTPANYNVDQTIHILAPKDFIAEGVHQDQISFATASIDANFNALSSSKQVVNITDVGVDIPNINVVESNGTTTATEGGNGDTITLVLNSKPTAPVTINTLPDSALSVFPAALIFTPANWDIPQTVNVGAIDDLIAQGTHFGVLSFSAVSTDPVYNNRPVTPVNVTITDNDVPNVLFAETGSSTDVAEGGLSDSYQMTLAVAPFFPVTLTLATDSSQLTLSQTVFTFTPGNYNIPQTVTVTAIDDLIAQGNRIVPITTVASGNDTRYNSLTIPNVAVHITDNDFRGISIAKTGQVGITSLVTTTTGSATKNAVQTLTFAAGNNNGTFTLTFNGQTTAPIIYSTTAATLIANIQAGLDSLSTIGAGNSTVAGTGPFTITFKANLGNTPLPAMTYAIVSGGSTVVTEGGATDTVKVSLTSQPTQNVTLTLAANSFVTASANTLNFTPVNWNLPQTVTITAFNDLIAQGTHSGTVTFSPTSADAGYAALAPAVLTATVIDNDVAGLAIVQTGGNTAVTEGVGADNYSIALTSQPTDTIVITESALGGRLTLSPTTLTFTPTNWFVPQGIQVVAVDDQIAQGNQTINITHSIVAQNSLDAIYPALPPAKAAPVPVLVTDNDFVGIVLFPSSHLINLTEGGAQQPFTVNLNSQPDNAAHNAVVVVNISNPDASLTFSPSTLTFDASNWDIPQTVQVAAIHDNIPEGLHTGALKFVSTSSGATGDATYNGVVGPNLTASITDIDYGVVLRETGGGTSVTRGEIPDTYDVYLSLQPQPGATVHIVVTAPSPLLISNAANPTPGSTLALDFNSVNWNTPITITIQAPNDFFSHGTSIPQIAHAISVTAGTDANYTGLAVRNLNVTLKDSLPDIIGRDPATGKWLINRSTGTSFDVVTTAPDWSNTATWLDVQRADVNGDGREDIIGREKSSGDWWVSLSQGASGYVLKKWGNWSPTETWANVIALDLNGDGKYDVVGRVIGGPNAGQWWAAISDGTQFNMQKWGYWSTAETWIDVFGGDFNGDGKRDIVGRVAGQGSNGGQWWLAKSTGTSFNMVQFGYWAKDVPWLDVRAEDYNGDGKIDMVGHAGAGYAEGQLWVGVSNGSTFTNVRWGTWNNVAWSDVFIADVDGNGKTDYIGRNGNDFWVGVSNGTNAFTITKWLSNAPVFVSTVYRDFNGDGKTDLAGRNAAGQWFVYLSNGVSGFGPATLWSNWGAANWVDVQPGYML